MNNSHGREGVRQRCSHIITNQPCPGTAVSRNDQNLPLGELYIMLKTLNLAKLSFIQSVFSLVKIPLFICFFSSAEEGCHV